MTEDPSDPADPVQMARASIDAGGHSEVAHSSRKCPHCGERAMLRQRRPWYLRMLKPFGLDIAAYSCRDCEKRSFIRR